MTEEPPLEPARPEPDFRVFVHREWVDGTGWTVSADVTHAVMDVYDIAINSMDFGSGFLSTEEVGNLRTLGKAIGADRFDYQHDKCLRCGHQYNQHYKTKKNCRSIKCSCTGFISPEKREES